MAVRGIKMSEAVAAKIVELAKKAHGSVKIGFIDSDQAPIAFWNEFGHKGRFPSPPRPFFRTMVSNKSPEWPKMMAGELKRSKMNGHKTLAFMGDHIEGDLRESIINFNSPALSDTTLRLRLKFGNNPQNIRARDVLQAQREVAAGEPVASGTQAEPLIWTHAMLDAPTYKVED